MKVALRDGINPRDGPLKITSECLTSTADAHLEHHFGVASEQGFPRAAPLSQAVRGKHDDEPMILSIEEWSPGQPWPQIHTFWEDGLAKGTDNLSIPFSAPAWKESVSMQSVSDTSTVAGWSPTWTPKTPRSRSRQSSVDGDGFSSELASTPPGLPSPRELQLTTIELRGLPKTYTQDMLLELLAEGADEGSYDFVYLPMDFESGKSLGYGFVNFVTYGAADTFRRFCSYVLRDLRGCDTICEALWSELQGLSELVRYRNSTCFAEAYQPELFTGAKRTALPSAGKNPRPARSWQL